MTIFKEWIEDHAESELSARFPAPAGFRKQKPYMVLPKGQNEFTFVIRNRRFAITQLDGNLEVNTVDDPAKNQKWTLSQNWLNENVADQQDGSELLEQEILHKIPVASAYRQIFQWMLQGVD